MGKLIAIYALASSPFLFVICVTATLSLAIAETLPHNIDFILNTLDPDPCAVSDYFVLLHQYVRENFFFIAFIVFILTIVSLLYIRYQIRGASMVALFFLCFYGGNVFLFISHLIFE
jgi:hypothetical protein